MATSEHYLKVLQTLAPATPLALSMMLACGTTPAAAELAVAPQKTGVASRLAAIRDAVSTLTTSAAASPSDVQLINWTNWSNWSNWSNSWSNAAAIGSALGLGLGILGDVLQGVGNSAPSSESADDGACQAAVDRFNEAKSAVDSSMSSLPSVPNECARVPSYFAAVRQQAQYLLSLRQAEEQVCGSNLNANVNVQEVVDDVNDKANEAQTQCQASLTPAPATPYAPSNQSASCSTITGPGMTGGPTNCPPNQPHVVTPAAPAVQTATVTPPAQPHVSTPTVTPTLPQILTPSVTLPQIFAPQPSPATDPETQARAAFDKGQTAFNAHDCATALQYFNEAVSLTVSYGSTYTGWRDRAQACTGPTVQAPTVRLPTPTVQVSTPTVQTPTVQPSMPTVRAPTVPTSDPETAARAAFDQGKASYDARNCAAALPYFNQAYSLTRDFTYAATYPGWADRAKACS